MRATRFILMVFTAIFLLLSAGSVWADDKKDGNRHNGYRSGPRHSQGYQKHHQAPRHHGGHYDRRKNHRRPRHYGRPHHRRHHPGYCGRPHHRRHHPGYCGCPHHHRHHPPCRHHHSRPVYGGCGFSFSITDPGFSLGVAVGGY